MQALGHRSAGISLCLGNYHNTSEDNTVVAEYVMLDDVKGLISLLKALVATKHLGIERPLHARVAMRQKEYAKHLAAGNELMK